MLTLHTDPHTVHGSTFILKDGCQPLLGVVNKATVLSVSVRTGHFMNSKRKLPINVVHEQLISTIYEQSIIPIDDTMDEDLMVSCCTEANNSVAYECQMNPDVKKWTSMSEGSDNFSF